MLALGSLDWPGPWWKRSHCSFLHPAWSPSWGHTGAFEGLISKEGLHGPWPHLPLPLALGRGNLSLKICSPFIFVSLWLNPPQRGMLLVRWFILLNGCGIIPFMLYFLRARLSTFPKALTISGRIPKLLLLSPLGDGTGVEDDRGPGWQRFFPSSCVVGFLGVFFRYKHIILVI